MVDVLFKKIHIYVFVLTVTADGVACSIYIPQRLDVKSCI